MSWFSSLVRHNRNSIKRVATAGIVGFATGGIGGALLAGGVSTLQRGKYRPLQSIATGAIGGFAGGVVAQKLGLQGATTKIGGFSFRPLSSRAIDWWSAGSTAANVAGKAAGAGKTGEVALTAGTLAAGAAGGGGTTVINEGSPGPAPYSNLLNPLISTAGVAVGDALAGSVEKGSPTPGFTVDYPLSAQYEDRNQDGGGGGLLPILLLGGATVLLASA